MEKHISMVHRDGKMGRENLINLPDQSASRMDYVLITAAYNEEDFIRYPVESVVSQTLLPEKWIIISDGSTDRTDDIVKAYASRYKFMEFVRRDPVKREEGFASKVFALKTGYKRLQGVDYRLIGNLDADVSFPTDYFENILKRFNSNDKLGIAGGFIHESENGVFRERANNSIRSVAGAIQMFRRECYESMGGLQPVPLGGEDWIAETMARMHGWEVEAFPEFRVLHHKNGMKARGLWMDKFRQGRMDYSTGSHPLFEVMKCLRRLRAKPRVLGAFIQMAGFLCGYSRMEKRVVPREFIEFLRNEQVQRLRSVARRTHPIYSRHGR
jgi:glycosyltransferase involved in cell wall biosynthesis